MLVGSPGKTGIPPSRFGAGVKAQETSAAAELPEGGVFHLPGALTAGFGRTWPARGILRRGGRARADFPKALKGR